MTNESNKYEIKSLIKSLQVLELVARNNKLSIKQISEMSGLGKSTAHRILATLKYMNYVNQDENSNYFATLKIFQLGTVVSNNIPIKRLAKPYLDELFAKCNETVNLGIMDNYEVVYLDKVLTKQPLRIDLDMESKIPFYCSALGKVMIAFNDCHYPKETNFKNFTTSTIYSDEVLVRELKNVQRLGYAIDDEEYIDGLVCLAVPICSSKGEVIAGISIAMPKVRLSTDKHYHYTSLLKETAKKIQSELCNVL